jgi:phospholipase C
MFMHENRSFDHYFGTFHGVEGFGDGSAPVFRQPTGNGFVLPYRIDNSQHPQIFDITHDWDPQHQSWDGGKMDQFAATHIAADGHNGAGVITMGYYERQDLPFHYAIADAFTICDHYHCSMIGPTDPNHLYWLSATIDPAGQHGGPLLETCGQTAPQGAFTWPTMPEALQAHAIPWKFYGTSDFSPFGFTQDFAAFNQPGVFEQQGVVPTFQDFLNEAAAGTLPLVSWVLGSFNPNSEHPSFPSDSGESELATALAHLTANPEAWAKTALFFTFDENGGYFDHVPPPTPPPGTAGEFIPAGTLIPNFNGCNKPPVLIDQPIGLGMRVPMMVISPFSRANSRGGFVCSDVFDHTSMLRFIETRFANTGLRVPNLTDWRRGVTGDMTSAFNFAAAKDTSVPFLPLPPTPTQCDDACQEVRPPSPQVPPQQEPGSPQRPSGCTVAAAAMTPGAARSAGAPGAVTPATATATPVSGTPQFTG